MKKICLLFLLLIGSSNYALEENPCDCSLKLSEMEYGFGAPFPVYREFTEQEYNERIKKLDLKTADFTDSYITAYMSYRLKKYDIAMKYFERAEKRISVENSLRYDHNAYFYLYYGLNSEALKDYDNAKKCYIKQKDPYYIHLINAKIYREKKELKKAEKEYLLAQCVNLYEMINYDPYEEIAQMYFENKKYILAKEYIKKFIACAEYEMQNGGLGYEPSDDSHIKKANKLLEKIELKIKKQKIKQ